ncbi:hypothetical protein MLD38_014935 [Melastoma candidum]|uniref:Uncharacterized protein n=1 Tax=Melastoma candidum TaxID=119954 RepID=A0ACB9RE02_9MYRT|nr:hypothetical protein MLD38_014935 [Melastoma candidum]
MVKDVLDLRANNWVSRNEEVKAKKITEIHSEAEKNLGLRPGATARIRNNRNMPGNPGAYPAGRLGTGGMMLVCVGCPGWMRTGNFSGLGLCQEVILRGCRILAVSSISVGRSPSLNARLLPQGSGGIIGGRPSALLPGSGASFLVLPAESPGQILGTPRSFPTSPTPVPGKPVVPAAKLNMDDLRWKTIALLEEYFGILICDEALQCIVELNTPG